MNGTVVVGILDKELKQVNIFYKKDEWEILVVFFLLMFSEPARSSPRYKAGRFIVFK